jgi:23S rRNA pseudouridine2605 synthase
MRLAKHLAHAGVASRRAAERLIADGRVTIEGAVVTDPARDVGPDDLVEVDGRALAGPEPRVVYALNKPVGVVSTARDPQGRPTVVELVATVRVAGRSCGGSWSGSSGGSWSGSSGGSWSGSSGGSRSGSGGGPRSGSWGGLRLYPVGRLDADSSGLILLTNDGELAELLTHPRHEVPKTYLARVAGGPVGERALWALRNGVTLSDGPTARARVRARGTSVLEITIAEGRNRQVRRMCEVVGHRVLALERVAFGPLRLGDLAPGAYRRLSEAEVERLRGASRGS